MGSRQGRRSWQDGLDGLGFEDMEEFIEDDGRVLVRRYKRGDQVKEFRHVTASMIYEKSIKPGTDVSARRYGDLRRIDVGVSQKDTDSKPGDGSPDWKLATPSTAATAATGKTALEGRDGGPERACAAKTSSLVRSDAPDPHRRPCRAAGSLAEVKAGANLDGSEDDAKIAGLIRTAVERSTAQTARSSAL